MVYGAFPRRAEFGAELSIEFDDRPNGAQGSLEGERDSISLVPEVLHLRRYWGASLRWIDGQTLWRPWGVEFQAMSET
jgi:hypothetical protein